MKCVLVVMLTVAASAWAADTEEEKKASVEMEKYNKRSQELKSIAAYADWDYDTTLTDEAAKKQEEADKNYNDYQLEIYPTLMSYNWRHFDNSTLYRLFSMASYLDEAALSKEKQANLSQILAKMLNIYSTFKVRDFNAQDKPPSLIIDDVADKFATDYLNVSEMNFYWREWHEVGVQEKELFRQWVELENETAILNGFPNNAARWEHTFETENFEKVLAQLYDKIKPFLDDLHGYIRYKLWLAHNKDSTVIDPKGPIPASLLGNMWGLDGINIWNITVPFPEKETLDATPQLQAQNYTGRMMAEKAEQFYTSMGFQKMTDDFWKYSIFNRGNRTMDCSPMAYRFFNGHDFRLKICTDPTMDYFGRVHHEMGHTVQYMQQDPRLVFFYQDAPNLGFDEAIGDVTYIWATSPNNLLRFGLIDKNIKLDKELAINSIFQSALADAFFLPYAYSLDKWRWGVMKGEITPDEYNCKYWKERNKYHGVGPPVPRNETQLDPAAKYHIIAALQYISYFVSGILKYQFLRSLCATAGYYDPSNTDKPLVFCDVYGSTAVGDKLKKMMSLGKSKPPPDALEVLTGQRDMDASALLEFYQPLWDWIKEFNHNNNVTVGWSSGHIKCHAEKGNKMKRKRKCQI